MTEPVRTPFNSAPVRRTTFVNREGQKYGRLTAVRYLGGKPSRWQCVCVCGNQTRTQTGDLRKGRARSCGCTKHESISRTLRRHGESHATVTPEYRIWSGMRQRCDNPSTPSYSAYGGRGIKVCERWQKYELFLTDMGRRPSPKHSIDRFPNNDGNYEPGNCRWATMAQQAVNKRSNRLLTFNGETLCISDWARRLTMDHAALGHRLEQGWSVEQALTQPLRTNKLNEHDVRLIRASSERLKTLSSRFGVTMAAISAIRTRKLWKHVL